MYADHSPDYYHPDAAPSCYFSIRIPPASTASSSYSSYSSFSSFSLGSTHYSIETPSITPISEYSPHILPDPTNPLLAFRPVLPESMSNPPDASRLLQLQTAAANGRSPNTLQHRSSNSSSMSSSSSDSSTSSPRSSSSGVVSPSVISCCRCRRESLMGMIQFSTNTYYCSHCARMVGYSAGG